MLKKIIQCKQVIPWMAGLLSVAVVPKAEAGTVELDTMGNIISIQDIQLIEGGVQIPGNDFTFTATRTYNINFFYGTFNDIFGDPSQPEFDSSCSVGSGSGLCFWQNESQATMLVDQINDSLNNTLNTYNQIPSQVAGTRVNVSPFTPNTTNLYLVPVNFNETSNSIRFRPGTHDSNLAQPWVTDPLIENNDSLSTTNYASAELTSEEFVAEIPESSNLIGIVVTGGLIVLVTRKK